MDHKNARDILEIRFSQMVNSISFVFATIEYHDAEPSIINLVAYADSTTTTPVGSTSAQGIWPTGDSYPQGALTFNSNQPFNIARIELPYQGALKASYFLIDTITVKTA